MVPLPFRNPHVSMAHLAACWLVGLASGRHAGAVYLFLGVGSEAHVGGGGGGGGGGPLWGRFYCNSLGLEPAVDGYEVQGFFLRSPNKTMGLGSLDSPEQHI